MIGMKVIQRGDRAAAWNRSGDVALVDGPRIVWTFGRRVELLPQFTAEPWQYLAVRRFDGTVEHVPGPATRWEHPVEDASIEVRDAIELKAGEAVMVTTEPDRNGETNGAEERASRRIIEGPAHFIPAANETVERLKAVQAGPNHYLVIERLDGRREHRPGPASIWFDPLVHAAIRPELALDIDANESLVVYRQEGASIERRVERGPSRFIPAPNEWLHLFRWHGRDPKNPQRKIPAALQFVKLRTIPEQMYCDVEGVRTADDALVTIKLMIFYELADIDRMLDMTHDPIADFINAATADAVRFAAGADFHAFKAQTERLNELATFSTLCERGARIGYRIVNVVYRGYRASDNLQAMHDTAIEARTKLCLEAETERQAQDLEDLRVERDRSRSEQRRTIEQAETEHKHRLARLTHAEQLRQERENLDQELEGAKRRNEVELAQNEAIGAQRLESLRQMQAMQIDLTRYLVAQYRNPDRLIRVDGAATPQLHLHQDEGWKGPGA